MTSFFQTVIRLVKDARTSLKQIVHSLQALHELLTRFIHTDIQQLIECLKELREIKELLQQVTLTAAPPPEEKRYDALYAMERIGVEARTLYRLIYVYKLLPVDSYINGRRHFRESDIEKCRELYRKGGRKGGRRP